MKSSSSSATAAEEMSPKNLNRLKRLLSISQEYSPRNNLATRWREYHGSNHWDNLLDPLDENLRREVVKYGEFVQAAYQAFQSNPSTTTTSSSENDVPPLSPRHVAVSDTSYKVTKSLYATSSIAIPSWVDDMAPDLSWLTQRSSWIGYVAVCDDPREIARMGRRDIVISLRGTSTCLEWAENVRDLLVKMPGDENHHHSNAKVECGFLSLYKTPGSMPEMPSLSESIVHEVRRLMNLYKGETLSISITGHSLGAALALLAADELSTCDIHVPPIAVFSFGGPRVGNRGFANRITDNGVKVLRVVNSQDVITRVPGMFVNETLDEKLRTSRAAGLLKVLDDNVPWAYSHVGSELRVDSKMSPYLKPNADVACCHDLEAYLHLVDGFCASNCPFRANAKRSLVKLLHEQGANVKKLYTSKAHGLKLGLDKAKVQIPNCVQNPS
ncbi:Phospholipase a1-ibeta2 protein [Thalictrum thalictroides]|uniref:Phospholipase a1-ibeta2 protein n=1 Tax=Thalictrum thalictroides TaxID=46969 RepID=A0A7J6UYD7_THATH|nr:Phospholipase a1-ibeta2 protein [Thalictrum thalictroides]